MLAIPEQQLHRDQSVCREKVLHDKAIMAAHNSVFVAQPSWSPTHSGLKQTLWGSSRLQARTFHGGACL